MPVSSTVLADDQPLSSAPSGQLLFAALAGIGVVVLLIVWAKFHPLLGLIGGTAVLGAVAAIPPDAIVTSFIAGLGDTFGAVGLLIALGSMLGQLLADSGGANRIVDGIIARVGRAALPWTTALIAAVIGLPMFFEIGLVILAPIVLLVARRTGAPLLLIGIPALAGLSILHGLVPPHPGPETAISLLGAPLSYTLAFGLIVAVPTLIIAGPMLATLVNRRVVLPRRETGDDPEPEAGTTASGATRKPSFIGAISTVLLPLILMLARAIADLTLDGKSTVRSVADFVGEPTVALLAGVLVAMLAVGRASGMRRAAIHRSLGAGLPPVASIILIVAAGGGFKTVLADSGVADVIADFATDVHMSVLLLGWLVAVAIRLATGSATVATVTAAGIVAPLGATLDQPHLALLVLAIGAGSLFFSHVNDAGFWLVKEYFGMTVGQTIRSWSLMETVISVVAGALVLALGAVV